MEIIIGLTVPVLLGFATLSYWVGKLTGEVRQHNKKLDQIERSIKELINWR